MAPTTDRWTDSIFQQQGPTAREQDRVRLRPNKVNAVPYGNKNHLGRFSVLTAEHALRVACHSPGLDHTNAEPIRLGENALFRLSSQPVVVRISRTADYWGCCQGSRSRSLAC
jgi:hypothetical protein